MVDGECRLSSFDGLLQIFFEGDTEDKISLPEKKPLIFKLGNDWTGAGRKVSGITKGHFVVIAPNKWERTGHAPVEPEDCADTNFKAHYFFRDGEESDEDVGGFRECEVALAKSRFELTGERVHDDSKDGDLFVGAVPSLKSFPDLDWARVGEEAENGWKGENFKPAAEGSLSKILNGRQGRFFVRVYDSNTKLRDSGQFRYLRDLKEIKVNGERYAENMLLIPPSIGHPTTKVRFIGIDGAAIRPILSSEATRAKEQKNELVVEPHPDGDGILCTLESGAGRVGIALKLPRVWWRIDRDGNETGAWRDTPLAMTRREFRENADAGTAIRLRLPPCAPSAKVGFNEACDRAYRPQKKGSDTEISLADFSDYSQIDRRLNEDASLNVACNGAKLTLIRVSADPAPTIIFFTGKPAAVTAGEQAALRWETRDAEADGIAIYPEIGAVESSGSLDVAPLETTIYTLRLTASGLNDAAKAVTVNVRRPPHAGEKPVARARRKGGGWRRGKGFSYGEIRTAGLTAAEAARRSMRIDGRRSSAHSVNIETIRRLNDA